MVRRPTDSLGDSVGRPGTRAPRSVGGRLSQGVETLVDMEATSLRFAAAARTLGLVARREGLDVPGFRSPPRLVDVDRTLRRRADGAAVVSIRLKGRPWVAVLADMIDGVVAANRLVGSDAARVRTRLWSAVEGDAGRAEPTRPPRAAASGRSGAGRAPLRAVPDPARVA
jgi:hypothetical protein